MRKRVAVRIRVATWQLVLAFLSFVQVVATFAGFIDRFYLLKWLAGVALVVCFFAIGRWRVSPKLLQEFALLVAILAIGLLSQLGETLDSRAVAIAASYMLTASAAFLIAPITFRRRSVQRLVWPAMLLGVTAGAMLGEYLGLRDPLTAVWSDQGRWRFVGAFYLPNAAGAVGLVGVILSVAAFGATRRWMCLAAAVPLSLVMVLADSRGSLLAAGTLFATPVIVRVVRWRNTRIALLTCLGVLVLLGFGLLHSASIAWPETSHAQAALNRLSTGRWASWGQSLGYLDGPSKWAFGLGLSRNLSFAARGTDFAVRVRGSNADNFFVDLLGRTGVAGLLLFFGITGSLAMKLCRGLTQAPPRRVPERALGVAVLAATLVLGATNSVILTWGSLHAMVAWPLVAAAASRLKNETGSAPGDRTGDLPQAAIT